MIGGIANLHVEKYIEIAREENSGRIIGHCDGANISTGTLQHKEERRRTESKKPAR